MMQTTVTPIHKINLNGIYVDVKRDDLNDPDIQGNKLRKLKYNIAHAANNGYSHMVTFGGAYSNHIAATAAAGKRFGLNTVGFIRGQEFTDNPAIWSNTLRHAHRNGMQLMFISREDYRAKHKSTVFNQALDDFAKPYVIPECGSNDLGVAGAAELISELQQQLDTLPTHVICACGTGGTLAGLIKGTAQAKLPVQIWGVVVHKAAAAIDKDIQKMCPQQKQVNWTLLDQYHFGGYAKYDSTLKDFAANFRQAHDITLDQVYNCKSFYALHDLIQRQMITSKDRPLIVHTGGLQGGTF